MSKMLLTASHIVKYFSDRKILEFERLTVYEGDRIGIVGANGAGKTTLLNILSGDLPPDEGTAAGVGFPVREGAGAFRQALPGAPEWRGNDPSRAGGHGGRLPPHLCR